MTKFEIWRQRRREQSAAEAAPPVEALRAERDALAAEASLKRVKAGAKAGAEPEQEDTVPAAFYRNVG